jgi:hypothetical protein
LLDEPTAVANLRRFVTILVVAITVLLLVVAFTPLASLWFGRVSALSPRLVELATWGLRLALPIPALNALQSWYQGAIMHNRRTRGITEALAIFLLLASAVMWAGVIWGKADGLYVSQVGFVVGWTANVAWLWVRSRPAMRAIQERCRAAQPA